MAGNNHKGIVLQERDLRLLRWTGIARITDGDQVRTAAGFGSNSRANRRIHALTEAGLLKRFFLGTRGPGQKALYSLSQKGAVLADVPYRGLQRRNEESLVADFFVEHQLRVNEVHLGLRFGQVPSGVTFLEWQAFYQPLMSGSRLIPDGYVRLTSHTGSTAAFLELDLGHERSSVWLNKVQHYIQLAVSGEYEKRFGMKRFRVLIVTTTDRRLESLRSTISSLTDKIFWLSTIEAVRKQGPYADVWLRPKRRDRQPLIEESPLT